MVLLHLQGTLIPLHLGMAEITSTYGYGNILLLLLLEYRTQDKTLSSPKLEGTSPIGSGEDDVSRSKN